MNSIPSHTLGDYMKALLVFTLLVSSISLFAQPREGKTKELSISGSYQSYSSGSSTGGSSAFLISPRLGFYAVKGLEIEPEVVLLFATGGPTYVLNGNISYNFLGTGNGVPFLLLGYGIANTVPFFNVPMTRTDFTVGVLNVGGGVKAYVTEDVALRVEYRYQRFSAEGRTINSGFFSYTEKVDVRIHTIQFGFSVLL